MTAINDHGLARDTGSHLIGTEWRYPCSVVLWTVTQAMYGVLRLQGTSGAAACFTVDELCREMQRVEVRP